MTSPSPVAIPDARPAPEPIAILATARERSLSRLLMTYIISGLAFMLLPGTFLGVWNLISISTARAANMVPPRWLQAHGHAQIFGWIGSFILGIGFYSIPKLLRSTGLALRQGWICWGLWTAGVALRWTSNVYASHWRALLPISAGLQLAAFLLFFKAVSGHSSPSRGRRESWIIVVIGATMGLAATLAANLAASLYLALRAAGPALPHGFDQRFLVLCTWGFLVPFVWGFSARWLPVFLGLQPLRSKLLLGSFSLNTVGVIAALAGRSGVSAVLLGSGAVALISALRLFEVPAQLAKTRGVHASFPVFVRIAYVWLLVSAALGIWAASTSGEAAGIWGASRHALTVGFIASMVFCVGQRILPAFSGMRHLFSARLMFASLLLVNLECALRVSAEVLAYPGYVSSAWAWLPVSALTEMAAVTLFAFNIIASFARPAPPVACSLPATTRWSSTQ